MFASEHSVTACRKLQQPLPLKNTLTLSVVKQLKTKNVLQSLTCVKAMDWACINLCKSGAELLTERSEKQTLFWLQREC